MLFLGQCRCVLFPYIMGKSTKWLKNVLLGKKTSKSSGSKGKEVNAFERVFYNMYVMIKYVENLDQN